MAYKSHMLKSNWLSDLGEKVKNTALSIAGGIAGAKGVWGIANTIYDFGKKLLHRLCLYYFKR